VTSGRASSTPAHGIVRDKFALTELTLVGDRGMITSARIDALRDLGGLSWITCLRAPAIKALAADDGPLQMSLFDTVSARTRINIAALDLARRHCTPSSALPPPVVPLSVTQSPATALR
jgi:hypothetical protein